MTERKKLTVNTSLDEVTQGIFPNHDPDKLPPRLAYFMGYETAWKEAVEWMYSCIKVSDSTGASLNTILCDDLSATLPESFPLPRVNNK